jgi:imidazole glycerol-phosphate synthase subunit HisH
MIAILDLGISNIGSLNQAFQQVGLNGNLTNKSADIRNAKAIILPGVGAYRDAMACLRDCGLVDDIRAAAAAGKPLLGICLGMQLLATRSAENGSHDGLGLIPGEIERLPESNQVRVPNIGWCDVTAIRDGTLFPVSTEARSFYFVHSYHFVPKDPAAVAATISTGTQSFAAIVESGNVFGVQFHPEKSQDAGLDLLSRYMSYLRKSGCYE